MKPSYGERLVESLGRPAWRKRLASSPRSVVWLADVDSTPVVVKQVVGGQDPAERFDRELTALLLAARVDPPVAPAVLGTDAERQVMVLEHIAGGTPPDDWIVGYASSLAGLHAATTAADEGILPRWSGPDDRDVDAFAGFAGDLGVDASAARGELADLLERLRSPGFALLHGDPCPANDLHTSAGVRFVDFEQASLGNGIMELAYLRIGFPTCWCATAPGPALLREAETAYRAKWHAVTGAELAGDLADACAGWLIRGDALVERAHRDGRNHLATVPHGDWLWGTATARQRLAHRLGVVASLATDQLAAVGRLSSDLREQLLARWPEVRPLPVLRPA